MKMSKLKTTLVATFTLILSLALGSQLYAGGRHHAEHQQMRAEMSAVWLDAIATQLQLTSEQQPAWDNYRQSWQQQFDSMQRAHGDSDDDDDMFDHDDLEDMEPEQRQSFMRAQINSRLSNMNNLIQTRSELLAVLTDEQRLFAEAALPASGEGGMKAGYGYGKDCGKRGRRGHRGWFH